MTLQSPSSETVQVPLPDDLIVENISKIITEVTIPFQNQLDRIVTLFDAKSPPSMTLRDYLKRLLRFCFCSNEIFIVSLVYLDRLWKMNKEIFPCESNIHRFFLIGLLVAIKHFEDKYYKNEYYAKVGGISPKEINRLELEFLVLIDFRLFVSYDVFLQFRELVSGKA